MKSRAPELCQSCSMYYDAENFCAKLTPDELADMNASSQILTIKRGDTISDNMVKHWPIIAISTGVLSLQSLLNDGRRIVAALFMRGDILELRNPSNRKFGHLVALSKVKLCRLSPRVFDRVMNENPKARLIAWEGLTSQAFSAISHASDLAKKQALEKLASFIFECRHRSTRKLPGNLVDIPIRRRDLADYLGMQPETVSRLFKELETRNIIKVTDLSNVQILQTSALRRIANGDRVGESANKGYGPDYKILVAGT